MLNRLLQYNYSTIGIFIFISLIKIVAYTTGQTGSGTYPYSLFNIPQGTSLWVGILTGLFALFIGLLIFINSEQNAKRNDFSYWIVLLFIIQISSYSFYALSPEYFGLLFFALSFYCFCINLTDHNPQLSTIRLFNLSISLGIGTLFTPHLIYILPAFWICYIITTSGNIKGFIASLMGIILPFILIDSIIFSLFSDSASYTHRYVIDQLALSLSSNDNYNITSTILINIIPIIITVISLYVTFKNTRNIKIVNRKFNNVNLIIFIYILALTSFNIIPIHYGLMLMYVPTAYFYSNLQMSNNIKQQNIILALLTLSVIISYPDVHNAISDYYHSLF